MTSRAVNRRRRQAATAAIFVLVGSCSGGQPEPTDQQQPSDSLRLTQASLGATCEAPDGEAGPPPPDTVASGAMALSVNLPAFRLDVREGDSLVASVGVAIGMPRHPSPTGAFAISMVEWNPWWIPPESDWARGSSRTPPGPRNPLGPVKMRFAPLFLLHGTPDSASIGSARSHGCIRLRNADAIAVAEMVQRFGAPDSSARLATATQRGRATRAVRLDRAVPVMLSYDLVEVRGDSVYAYPDVYRLRSPTLEHEAALAVRRATGADSLSALAMVRHLLDLARDSVAAVPIRGEGPAAAPQRRAAATVSRASWCSRAAPSGVACDSTTPRRYSWAPMRTSVPAGSRSRYSSAALTAA